MQQWVSWHRVVRGHQGLTQHGLSEKNLPFLFSSVERVQLSVSRNQLLRMLSLWTRATLLPHRPSSRVGNDGIWVTTFAQHGNPHTHKSNDRRVRASDSHICFLPTCLSPISDLCLGQEDVLPRDCFFSLFSGHPQPLPLPPEVPTFLPSNEHSIPRHRVRLNNDNILTWGQKPLLTTSPKSGLDFP